MPSIINTNELEFVKNESALEEFKLNTLMPRLGSTFNSKHFTIDIRSLDPDKYSFPYHFHRNAEELIYILSGSCTLRTNDGLKVLNKGDIAFFEIGETGAHQLYNHTENECQYIDLRTTVGLDVSEYPDSNKLAILPNIEVFDRDSKINYNDREENIKEIWKKLK